MKQAFIALLITETAELKKFWIFSFLLIYYGKLIINILEEIYGVVTDEESGMHNSLRTCVPRLFFPLDYF